jgi:hypothetical protein
MDNPQTHIGLASGIAFSSTSADLFLTSGFD